MNFEKIISDACDELGDDRGGRLSLARRKSIWLGLASGAAAQDAHRMGYERRVALDTLCVQRVMPVWSRCFPGDDGPEQMLAIAARLLVREIDPGFAQELRDGFYVDVVEDREYPPDNFPAMFVAHAAANTVITALVENVEGAIPDVDDDESLDPESYLPSYLCASAYAGGLDGSLQASVERRRGFWMWYLKEAIPEVMRQGDDH